MVSKLAILIEQLSITSPSTIAASLLDSKPLRAFSPVMAGVMFPSYPKEETLCYTEYL